MGVGARLQVLLYEHSTAIVIFPVACATAVLSTLPLSHWTHRSLVILLGVVCGCTVAACTRLALRDRLCPRRLIDKERALVQEHAQAGHDMLADVPFPWPVVEMVLQHHERLDGSGYLNGLHGGQISRGARVTAVADTFEAVISHRPYRPGLGMEHAPTILGEGRDLTFDRDAVDACTQLVRTERFHSDE